MKLVGILPVRNEDWILGLTARVALQWCDDIVVGLHDCADLSETVCNDIEFNGAGERIHMQDLLGGWDEMRHRQEMLNFARSLQATHVAIIDADEMLSANLLPRIRSLVEATPPGSILQLPLYNLRGGIHRYHANGIWGNRIVSVAFPDDPVLHWGGDTFHAREPRGRRLTGFLPIPQNEGGVIHFWGASEKRLHEKHRLYRITERLRWPGKPAAVIEALYSMAEKGRPVHGDTPGKWVYRGVPQAWYAGYEDLMTKHLNVDADPWQRAECDRLIAEHGREKFAGLDLFGL